jgi:hypothetical protein
VAGCLPGEARIAFAPRRDELYHLWCDLPSAWARPLSMEMVSVVFDNDGNDDDDAETSVSRNYRALLDVGVLQKPRVCFFPVINGSAPAPPTQGGDDRTIRRPVPGIYPDLLLAAARALRSSSRLPQSDRDAFAACFSRHGISSTRASLALVEELVLENERRIEHEREEERLLLQHAERLRAEAEALFRRFFT